jgi:hypothetical protein
MAPLIRGRDLAIAVVVALCFWTGVVPTRHGACPPLSRHTDAVTRARPCAPCPEREAAGAAGGEGRAGLSDALDMRSGDRLVLYRRAQPYYHTTQLPHDWIVVKSATHPSFYQVRAATVRMSVFGRAQACACFCVCARACVRVSVLTMLLLSLCAPRLRVCVCACVCAYVWAGY